MLHQHDITYTFKDKTSTTSIVQLCNRLVVKMFEFFFYLYVIHCTAKNAFVTTKLPEKLAVTVCIQLELWQIWDGQVLERHPRDRNILAYALMYKVHRILRQHNRYLRVVNTMSSDEKIITSPVLMRFRFSTCP